MTIKNNKFNYRCCNLLIINEEINKWANKNNIILIPFQNKYLNFISDILWEAMYKDGQEWWVNYSNRDWKEKLKEMSINGKPDYVAFKIHCCNFFEKKIEFYFLEYKTKGDGLSKDQIKWFSKYYKFPLMVVHSIKSNKMVVKHFNKEELSNIKKEVTKGL